MKNTTDYITCFLALSVVIISCGRAKPQGPEATTLDSTLVVPSSSLSVPIRYHVDSLQTILNQKVQGTFLKQWVVVNENNDSLYLELIKQRAISLAWTNSTLLYQFPLRIEGKFIKHIGNRIRLKNETPVTMEVVLEMETQLSFNTDWSLQPHTRVQHIVWTKEPVLKVAFVTINLRKKVESLLLEKEESLTKLVDDAILKLIDTKSMMEKLWVDIQKPILLNRQKKKIWLHHRAENLNASLVQDGKYLGLDVLLQTKIRTLVEGDEIIELNHKLPPYTPATVQESGLSLYILSSATFSDINFLLNEELRGKELSAQGYSARIKNLQVYGTARGLALQVEVQGDASGTLYAYGTPEYDSATSTLKIKHIDFDVASEDVLVKSADWLLHEDALSLLEEKLSLELAPLIEKLPQTITEALERGKTGKKMELFISSLDVTLYSLLITQADIQFILQAKGKAVIGLQKDLFAKKHKAAIRSTK